MNEKQLIDPGKMKYKINRLNENDNLSIATVITGYEEELSGNSSNEVFFDYRHWYAEDGSMSWDLVAIDENNQEYFEKGERNE